MNETPRRYVALCECRVEGVVVLFYEPSGHWEDDDIALSIWREWQPNSLTWRIRQAWAVLMEREKVAEWGVLLSRAEARALAAKLNEYADLPPDDSGGIGRNGVELPRHG